MSSELIRIAHWGPLTALFIIKCISLTTLYFTSMWLPAQGSFVGLFNHLIFLVMVGMTLYNFFCAACLGPGHVPLKWAPKKESERAKLQFCVSCNAYKAPRAHHCRKCGRCVLKMDHHCPWINNCCGHRNHAYFTMFLASAVVGSIHSLFLLICGLYRGYHANYYFVKGGNFVYLTFTSLLFGIFSAGLAIGVIFAVGGLFYIQMRIILRNMTSIEDWIVAKAESREREVDFIYPYDLGFIDNFKEVFLLPLHDGIQWPIVKGCDQYTLTVEQLEQKQEKRVRARPYQVIEKYSGHWFPIWSYGLRTCIRFPFSDESRIALNAGEYVYVTRWKKYWMYGHVADKADGPDRRRGWFPRRSVVLVTKFSDPIPGHSGDRSGSSIASNGRPNSAQSANSSYLNRSHLNKKKL